MKKLTVIVLVLALCFGVLSGCGASFDAAGLVKGNIDLIYLNQYTDEYLKSVSITADQADAEYESGIDMELEFFSYYYEIVPEACDDTIVPRLRSLLMDIYDHSKYEIGEQAKVNDNYVVEFIVYPIDIVQQVNDYDLEAFYDEWTARSESGEFDTVTEEEFETAWAEGILELFEARLDSIGYLEPETISVQVVLGDDNKYIISDNDMGRIDELIIAY